MFGGWFFGDSECWIEKKSCKVLDADFGDQFRFFKLLKHFENFFKKNHFFIFCMDHWDLDFCENVSTFGILKTYNALFTDHKT
ncbi:unnamed protein product [Rhizophagus irregularis]|nr:unnamed protein product [Rhizophagus irregularis]